MTPTIGCCLHWGRAGTFPKVELDVNLIFRACFQHNGDSRTVCIPDMKPVGLFLSHELIAQIIAYCVGGRLPVEHGTVALMIRAADFLGDTWVLQRLTMNMQIFYSTTISSLY